MNSRFQNFVWEHCNKDNLTYSVERWKKEYNLGKIDYVEMQHKINADFYNEYLDHFCETKLKIGRRPSQESRAGLVDIELVQWLAIYNEQERRAQFVPFVFNNEQTKIKTLLDNKLYVLFPNESTMHQEIERLKTKHFNIIYSQLLHESERSNTNIRGASINKRSLEQSARTRAEFEAKKEIRSLLYESLKADYTRNRHVDSAKIHDSFALMDSYPFYKFCADSRGYRGMLLNKYLKNIDGRYVLDLDYIDTIANGISELESISMIYFLEERDLQNDLIAKQTSTSRKITDF